MPQQGEACSAVHLPLDHLRFYVESELSNRPCLGLADVDDWQADCAGREVKLPGRWASRWGCRRGAIRLNQ